MDNKMIISIGYMPKVSQGWFQIKEHTEYHQERISAYPYYIKSYDVYINDGNIRVGVRVDQKKFSSHLSLKSGCNSTTYVVNPHLTMDIQTSYKTNWKDKFDEFLPKYYKPPYDNRESIHDDAIIFYFDITNITNYGLPVYIEELCVMDNADHTGLICTAYVRYLDQIHQASPWVDNPLKVELRKQIENLQKQLNELP